MLAYVWNKEKYIHDNELSTRTITHWTSIIHKLFEVLLKAILKVFLHTKFFNIVYSWIVHVIVIGGCTIFVIYDYRK